MENKTRKIGALSLSFTIAGCFLGAGYVSGQELWQFFGSFGAKGVAGLLLAVALLFFTGIIMILLGRLTRLSEIDKIVVRRDWPLLRGAVTVLELLFLFGVGTIMSAGVGALRVLHEFRLENANEMNVGDVVKADAFKEGDKVDVTGISKGKGYAGVIKRWGAQRTPMTHGGGPVHRHAGSMGSSTDPSRILPGKIGAGHMGAEQVTVQNLDVVKVDPELNMIVIRGAIPGPKGGIVFIKNTAKTLIVKQASVSTSVNPQKASARTNPQKASARNR